MGKPYRAPGSKVTHRKYYLEPNKFTDNNAINTQGLVFLVKQLLSSNFDTFVLGSGKINIWNGSEYVDMTINQTVELLGGDGIKVVGNLTNNKITFSTSGDTIGKQALNETTIEGLDTNDPDEYFLYYNKQDEEVQYMSIDDLALKIAASVASIIQREKVQEFEMVVSTPPNPTPSFELEEKMKDGTFAMVFINGQLMDEGADADYEIDDTDPTKTIVEFKVNYAIPTEPAKVKIIYKY